MASGNGDNSYVKCEYPDDDDDEDVPNEDDFIAPIDYIDPVSIPAFKLDLRFLPPVIIQF